MSGITCSTCHQKIVGPGLEALGNKYHPDCFVCGSCKGKISGAFIDRNGVPWHKECVPAPPRIPCAVCHKDLVGRTLNALGKSYHAECFKCGGCHKPLDGSFIAPDGHTPFHAGCYTGGEDAVNCVECGKRISGRGVQLEPKRYLHEECFVCHACRRAFGKGEMYVTHDRHHYHQQCSPSAVSCHACHDVICEDHLKVNGHHYHTRCWKCAACGQPADENMVVLADKPYHIGKCSANIADFADDE